MPLRPSLIAVFAAVFACPLAAQATKTVGAATQGTLLFMEASDVACDLTLRDAAGKRFRALAEFEICEQKALLNKRVRLTYAPARVLADECQGNPDCRKSKTVMLVVVARPVSAVETLCIGAESIVFNCPAGDKVVSVCSSRNASSAAGYLQYRCGKPVGGPPEMTLPATEELAARGARRGGAILGWRRRFAALRQTALRYVVYEGIGNWGPGGAKREIGGVVVERDGRRIANVKCAARPKSELAPDWFERTGIASNGQDFEFPTSD